MSERRVKHPSARTRVMTQQEFAESALKPPTPAERDAVRASLSVPTPMAPEDREEGRE